MYRLGAAPDCSNCTPRGTKIDHPDSSQHRWRRVNGGIGVEAVQTDRRFQPREELSPDRVRQYAEAMRRGETFPPIRVAKVDGQLYVVDGFHRLEAAKLARRPTIEAETARMTERQATMFAIAANATHGLSLSRADKRRCFQLYYESKSHLRPNGSTKSLRQIRSDLSNIAWPNTISRWLREAGVEPSQDDGPSVSWSDEAGPDELRTERLEDFATNVAGVERLFHLMEDDEERQEALRTLTELTERLKVGVTDRLGLDI